MELEELISALSQHAPEPVAVLASLRTKRRRRIRAKLLAGTGIGTCMVVAIAVVFTHLTEVPSSVPSSDSGANANAANGCAAISLAETLATARSAGASVVVAQGALSGPGRPDENGGIYDPMTLTSVRTLSGPTIASGTTVWVSGSRGPSGPIPGADAGALWAPDGQLFGIVWPADIVVSLGPSLRVAPIVDDQVILSLAGCWQATDLPANAFTGKLAEIPGSDSYARAARGGFHAVPLATVEQLATQ